MTTETKNFLGIPIDGDISGGETAVAQRPLSELEPLLRAVIDDITIVEFGWTQYTPYFNDGDPCVFSLGEPWFRTTADKPPAAADDDEDDEDEDEDDEHPWEMELDSSHPSLGHRPCTWNHVTREYVYGDYVGPDPVRYERVKALADAIGSGAFNNVFLEAFGDHARVRVRRTGITVREYSHD